MARHHENDGSTMSVPFLPKWKQNEPRQAASSDERESTTSFFQTCLNGLNALSGVGILSISYALASGGWLSLILLFAIAGAAFYSGILIKRCMDMDSNIRTYPDIGDLAFGKIGRLVVSLSMYTELYLVATGFLILEGDNLHNLFPNTEIEIGGFAFGGKQLFVVIVALVIMPTVWLDDLSLLSYVSGSGVFASLVIIFSVFYTAIVDESGIEFHGKGTAHDLLNWNGIPTAVSLYAFCYCAHPVFPSLHNSMGNKHQFSNTSLDRSHVLRAWFYTAVCISYIADAVLLICFVLSTAGYASMAIIGYLMFGAEVESQITLNLPLNKISSQIAIYTTLVNPICKYALMVTPITNALKGLLPQQHEKKKNRVTSVLISTTLVITTIIVALAFPFFGSFTSLVGAFLSITASILLPCACYLKISGSYRNFGCEMVAIVTIIVLGVVIAIFGTYTALVQIINNF